MGIGVIAPILSPKMGKMAAEDRVDRTVATASAAEATDST